MAFSSLHQQKPPFFRALPAYAINLFLLAISTQAIGFLAVEGVQAPFFIAALFYWVVHNPYAMPLWFVFLGGLGIDLAVDGLLGLHAFIFLLYYMLLYRVRRIVLSQPPLYQFCVFALSVAAIEAVRWLAVSLLLWRFIDILPFVMAMAVCVITFPFIRPVLRLAHRIMSGYGRSFQA